MVTWFSGASRNPNPKKVQYVPDRTGNGDAIAGVANPFVAIGSSSSSSGDIVSSDCIRVTDLCTVKGEEQRTSGFFFGFRPPDFRRPLSVTANAEGVIVSTAGVGTSRSSLPSDATSSSD